MRQIVLDTETTGISPAAGHRIIEIGCVELIDRKLTGNHFHYYLNPDREIDAGAVKVHGITTDFLQDKPRFHDIVKEFIDYSKGAEVIIHNAPFDVGFIDHELARLAKGYLQFEKYCSVFDTLPFARQRHPGQKNSLDALCKRYHIDNSHRELHGALLDSQILAQVYLAMTTGQETLFADASDSNNDQQEERVCKPIEDANIELTSTSATELADHQEYIDFLRKTSGDDLIDW